MKKIGFLFLLVLSFGCSKEEDKQGTSYTTRSSSKTSTSSSSRNDGDLSQWMFKHSKLLHQAIKARNEPRTNDEMWSFRSKLDSLKSSPFSMKLSVDKVTDKYIQLQLVEFSEGQQVLIYYLYFNDKWKDRSNPFEDSQGFRREWSGYYLTNAEDKEKARNLSSGNLVEFSGVISSVIADRNQEVQRY